MAAGEFWDVGSNEKNDILKKFVHTSHGDTNKELLGWHMIAKIMNDDDDLEWNNHGRASNDFIIRYHWQEFRRKEVGEEAGKAKGVGEKKREKKAA
jgi:hypothetical protein